MNILTTIRYKDNLYMAGDEGKLLEAATKADVVKMAERGLVALKEPDIFSADATDSAVKLAKEAGIDLGEVTGTGAGGRITKADVEALIE